MMTLYQTPHILMLVSTIVLIAVLMLVVSKLPEKWQNVVICFFIILGTVGIFFLHATKRGTTFDIKNLLIEQLQVCNFNFILLPLCLIPKNEIGRQYLFYFSLIAAASTFFSYPSDVENSQWYSLVCLNFWIDHFCIVIVPLLMLATRRFKPKLEYAWKVTLCVTIYFFIAFIGNYMLNGFTFENQTHNHSYTMNAGSILVLEPLFNLIPIPFVYLLPCAPVLLLLFFLCAKCFKNYKTKPNYGNFVSLKTKLQETDLNESNKKNKAKKE